MDARLDLDTVIRPQLARMEDSLIFDLFERSRFKVNDAIYRTDGIRVYPQSSDNVSDYSGLTSPPDMPISFLDFLLKGTEELYAKAGKFNHPGEFSFFNNLPTPLVQRVYESSPVKEVGLNLNAKIKKEYLQAVRNFCEEGDDGHYGSSAVCDIRCLDVLSRRIHYGTYVAEAKFQEKPELYTRLINAKDEKGIENELTVPKVEEAIINRVYEKGKRYGLNPDFIAAFYKNNIIPLTKEVEVEYLIKRK